MPDNVARNFLKARGVVLRGLGPLGVEGPSESRQQGSIKSYVNLEGCVLRGDACVAEQCMSLSLFVSLQS